MTAGRKCEGYAPEALLQKMGRGPTSPFINADEVNAFQFFQEQSSEYLGKNTYRPFWSITIPQLCYTSPLIKSLVISIAMIHRIEDTSLAVNPLRERRLFWAHYNKAITQTAQMTENELGMIVLGMALYILCK